MGQEKKKKKVENRKWQLKTETTRNLEKKYKPIPEKSQKHHLNRWQTLSGIVRRKMKNRIIYEITYSFINIWGELSPDSLANLL